MAQTTDELLAKLKANKAKVGGTGGAGRPKPVPHTMGEGGVNPVKLGMYGHTGTGKTFFNIGPLACGERIYVLSADFGSNGLVTLENYYRHFEPEKMKESLARVRFLELDNYTDTEGFLQSPRDYDSEIEKFDPTVLEFEGFSSFNIDILDEHILAHAPGADGAGDLRKAGFTHTQQDWQGMKRGTLRVLRYFLSWHLGDKPIHKILTSLESAPDVNDLTNKTERTMLIHGTARNLMGPAFDVILECFKREGSEGLEYCYRCDGTSDKFLVKGRGFQLEPIEKANPERIWKILKREG